MMLRRFLLQLYPRITSSTRSYSFFLLSWWPLSPPIPFSAFLSDPLIHLLLQVMFCVFCIWAKRKHDQREASVSALFFVAFFCFWVMLIETNLYRSRSVLLCRKAKGKNLKESSSRWHRLQLPWFQIRSAFCVLVKPTLRHVPRISPTLHQASLLCTSPAPAATAHTGAVVACNLFWSVVVVKRTVPNIFIEFSGFVHGSPFFANYHAHFHVDLMIFYRTIQPKSSLLHWITIIVEGDSELLF